ncbi:E3 ubiquitin-protein ligase TRIM39-like [Trichomycterus rosablanca]|uniref:E3 ubiquitin-protein ligase TRIM39-like n=1 Tax=Trichomycterus rosablanca TaxID=2290929 RepID=UPI002F360CDB
MAFSGGLLNEEQLLCSICLDVFTDPVSTPCGHNFCMSCLRACWTVASPCQCPVCKEPFPRKPELRVNTFISELAAQFRRSVHDEPRSSRPPESCAEGKLEDLKSCLNCGAAYCDSHRTADKKCKPIDPVKRLQGHACQTHGRSPDLFCRDDKTFVCKFCAETEHKAHDAVTVEEEGRLRKSQLEMKQAEVQRMIQVRVEKIKEFRHSVEFNTNNKEKEAAGGTKVFADLIRCIERRQAEFLNQIEEQHRAAESQAADLIRNLERELGELQGQGAELEDPRHLLQLLSSSSSRSETWTDVSISTDVCEETLRKALIQVQESVQEEIVKLDKIKLKRIRRYAVDVTLNPDTVHPYLRLSADGKQVSCGDAGRTLPNNPERFDRCPCVLGVEGFSSGRFYYRVQVGGKTDWDLGVAGESADRKGMITACPENGFWSVCLRNSTQYMACDSRWVSLPLKRSPQEVGVFVDYQQGVVSFYDLTAKSLMYSFTGQSFTEKLHPYFSPCLNNGGENAAPMIIVPAEL